MNSAQAARTPFFGSYILETTGNRLRKKNTVDNKKRNIKLKEIFQVVDDYIEQA